MSRMRVRWNKCGNRMGGSLVLSLDWHWRLVRVGSSSCHLRQCGGFCKFPSPFFLSDNCWFFFFFLTSLSCSHSSQQAILSWMIWFRIFGLSELHELKEVSSCVISHAVNFFGSLRTFGPKRTYVMKVLVAQSCLTLCNPMDCSLLGSSVYGILWVKILEWVAMPSSRGSSQPRDQTRVSCIADRLFTIWATREALWQSCICKFTGKIWNILYSWVK